MKSKKLYNFNWQVRPCSGRHSIWLLSNFQSVKMVRMSQSEPLIPTSFKCGGHSWKKVCWEWAWKPKPPIETNVCIVLMEVIVLGFLKKGNLQTSIVNLTKCIWRLPQHDEKPTFLKWEIACEDTDVGTPKAGSSSILSQPPPLHHWPPNPPNRLHLVHQDLCSTSNPANHHGIARLQGSCFPSTALGAYLRGSPGILCPDAKGLKKKAQVLSVTKPQKKHRLG